MLKEKVLKILSTIFECIGVGGFLVYLYNYFTLKGKYDVIPKEVNANLNTYLLIGISGILLFIIFKVLKYFTIPRKDKYEQIKIHLDDELTNISDTQDDIINSKYMNEEKYLVPTDKEMLCPNCEKIVDKNATICLHCGFLLQSFNTLKDKFDEQRFIINSFKKLENKFDQFLNKLDEKIKPSIEIKETQYTPEYEQSIEEPKYDYTDIVIKEKKNNLFLIPYFVKKALPVVLILIMLSIGGYLLINNINNKPNNLGNEKSFYDIANNIINEVENKYNNNEILLNKNTVYFSLSDLKYTSKDYNVKKSYIAINASDKNDIKYYISLLGTGSYNNYSINITEKNELDLTDVVMNTPIISDIDNKLLIDNETGVTIYYKE